MAAVMRENWLELQGLGHELLLAWAPWARDDAEGKHSWNVRPRVDRGYHGDPPREFFVVDKIVAPFRLAAIRVKRFPWQARDQDKWDALWWEVASRYYLGEQDPGMMAEQMGWSEQRVLANLVAFGALVEREFRDLTRR